MKFLDVKTDYAFKRVLGSASSVPLLISFLNAILDYAGNFVMQEKTQFISRGVKLRPSGRRYKPHRISDYC